MNKKGIILLILILSSLLIAQNNQNERMLNVGAESDIAIFDPWVTTYQVDAKIFWNIMEPLVTLEENRARIKPHLAASWEVSGNNRIWIFKLREGVKFHDGSTLSADDVVASVSLFQNFEARVEKVDNLTVRFDLAEPNSSFLYLMGLFKHAITSVNAAQRYKSLEREGRLSELIPIGTGPFKFIRWDKGRQVVLESFSDYWQGAPWYGKLIFNIISDNSARISSIEEGRIDVLDVLFPADIPRIRQNKNLIVGSKHGMSICYIALNTAKKPLDNIKVRQALNLAVDKMKITRLFFYGGYGVPTNRVLSPGFWGFSALPSPGIYQPANAKRMLDNEGYENGFTLRLLCAPLPRAYLPNPKGVAEEIKKQFANIGVQVNIVLPNSWAEYDSVIKSGNYDMVLTGWTDPTGNPDYTFYYLLGSEINVWNFSNWRNEQFEEKLKFARELPINDMNGRIRLYNEAQNIFQGEAPWIPLIHTKTFLINNKAITGIISYPNGILSFHKARMEN